MSPNGTLSNWIETKSFANFADEILVCKKWNDDFDSFARDTKDTVDLFQHLLLATNCNLFSDIFSSPLRVCRRFCFRGSSREISQRKIHRQIQNVSGETCRFEIPRWNFREVSNKIVQTIAACNGGWRGAGYERRGTRVKVWFEQRRRANAPSICPPRVDLALIHERVPSR